MSQSDQLVLSTQISIDDITNNSKSDAPDIDKVQNEHLVFGGRTLLQCLSNLYSAIFTYTCSYIPSAWKTGIPVPIYKEGNKPKINPGSYRAISFLPSMYKLLEKVIHQATTVSEYAATMVSKENGF